MALKKDIESKLYWVCMDMAENLTEEDASSITEEDEVNMTVYAVSFRRAFESYVTLADITADTYSGDNLERDLYDALPCQDSVDPDDFSLWLWGNLS